MYYKLCCVCTVQTISLVLGVYRYIVVRGSGDQRVLGTGIVVGSNEKVVED